MSFYLKVPRKEVMSTSLLQLQVVTTIINAIKQQVTKMRDLRKQIKDKYILIIRIKESKATKCRVQKI